MHVYAPLVPDAPEGQKTAMDSFEMEIQMFVRCHMRVVD